MLQINKITIEKEVTGVDGVFTYNISYKTVDNILQGVVCEVKKTVTSIMDGPEGPIEVGSIVSIGSIKEAGGMTNVEIATTEPVSVILAKFEEYVVEITALI